MSTTSPGSKPDNSSRSLNRLFSCTGHLTEQRHSVKSSTRTHCTLDCVDAMYLQVS